KEISDFRKKTEEFAAGAVSKAEYKGFSGRFGSYAQRDGKSGMLRLRMTGGRAGKDQLSFISETVKKYGIEKIHFTTCQTIQLHDLKCEKIADIMEAAFDAGIITMGGGGDYPRNVMCSPLSGVEKGEYFDVMPYAKEAGDYAMSFIDAPKMPRKLKIAFSNSDANVTHATFRDLGFVATADGNFDVYSAGGLGNNPKLGIKVAEGVDPSRILYYIKAMWLMFCSYGNYENRGKARTRYMQDVFASSDEFRATFEEKLIEAEKEQLSFTPDMTSCSKAGCGTIEHPRAVEQKQTGLYAVEYHPIGGNPSAEVFCDLVNAIADMDDVEMRLAPDSTAYIINLNAAEAEKVIDITSDSACGVFEASVSCVGASICQVGLRDSQALLRDCIMAVREAKIAEGALPKIHISGCPSSCGTHQIGLLGFRGASKRVDGSARAAFAVFSFGEERKGEEQLGNEIGVIEAEKIPEFLVRLGKTVQETGKDYTEWISENKDTLLDMIKEY
ncbi:MAG: nitrite/sulfite reductase, partial [Lachnospiraceae bacterium]